MLECARSLFRQFAHEVFRSVRQLNERHVAGEAEHLLDAPHQWVGEEQQHAVHGQVFIHGVIHRHDAVVLHQLHSEIDGTRHDGDQRSRAEQLGAVGELAQRIDGHQSSHQLDNDEFILVFHGGGADEHHDDMRDEGRPRVEEHAHKDGCDGQGQHVDAE